MKKILIVTKDVAEFNQYYPVAIMLKERGAEVQIVAEGLSMDKWIKSGWEIVGGLPKDSFDPNTKTRYDLDVIATLGEINPDVVMTGLADPIYLGRFFGLTAQRRGIRLGFVEDIWFAHRRSDAVPDFVCTLDSYGEKAVAENERYKNCLPKVYITGSPAMDSLATTESNPLVSEIVGDSSFEYVVLIAGQGDHSGLATTRLLEGLSNALDKTDKSCFLIPRLHPKWLKDPSRASIVDYWKSLLLKMEVKHRVLWTPLDIPTVSIVPIVDQVVGVFSNLLLESLVLGTLPISWMSPEGIEEMQKSLKTNITSFPLAQMGAALEVSTPEEYLERMMGYGEDGYHDFMSKAQNIFPSDFKATERVVDAILV